MCSLAVNPALFHPAPDLLGRELWKVASPWAVSFSMHSLCLRNFFHEVADFGH